jgi:TLC domain
LAEVSNPFMIMRMILKILKKKDTVFYKVNEFIFAGIFLIARVLLTPFFMIYMFEGENILYSIKLGVSFILYVQLFWAYRILYLLFDG